MTSNLLKLAREARQRALGPFSPSFNVQEVLLESLQKVYSYALNFSEILNFSVLYQLTIFLFYLNEVFAGRRSSPSQRKASHLPDQSLRWEERHRIPVQLQRGLAAGEYSTYNAFSAIYVI